MVKLIVLAALLSASAVNGQPQSSADKSLKSDTPVSAAPREQVTETGKLRSETDSLRKQRETVEVLKDWASVGQSLATILSFVIGGWWIYAKFVRAQEKYSNIEFSADINIIGEQHGSLIVELIAYLENKGKAQHRMEELKFDLSALLLDDLVLPDQRWGGQINFPHQICEGSFLPANRKFFFVDPGTKAKYSYIARIPQEVSFLMLHCWFDYAGRGQSKHAAERTIKIFSPSVLPNEDAVQPSGR
jgi:hypothetical protein